MKNKILITILLFLFVFPYFVLAQEAGNEAEILAENHQDDQESQVGPKDEVFEAIVLKIIGKKEIVKENGAKNIQQNLLVRGLDGEWKDKEIQINGISDLEVAGAGVYEVGDQVIIQRSGAPDGSETFTVIDFVRRGYLYLLAFVFILITLLIGRIKGLKALLSLVVSFFIIIYFMLPRILSGGNPLTVGVLGAFAVLAVIIYLTEGWNRKSHLAMASVFLSLVVTMILSLLFTGLTRLTGFSAEEASFLLEAGKKIVDFRGLLLAGMLIGAVGVLDDVIVGQIEAVRQIQEANPSLPARKVFGMAYRVGNTHLGAIVNTLFLTYAGASLPILLLFVIKQEPFLTFSQIINNEAVATEIVRTLVGSIGVAMSMPIATFLGAYYLKTKN